MTMPDMRTGAAEVGRGSFNESQFESVIAQGYAIIDDCAEDPLRAGNELALSGPLLAASLDTDRALDTVDLLQDMITAFYDTAFVEHNDKPILSANMKRTLASGLVLGKLSDAIMARVANETDPRLACRFSNLLLTAFAYSPSKANYQTSDFLAAQLPALIAYNQEAAAANEPPNIFESPEEEDEERDVLAGTVDFYPELERLNQAIVQLVYRSNETGREDIKQALAQTAFEAPDNKYARSTLTLLAKEAHGTEIICHLVGLPSFELTLAWVQGYSDKNTRPGQMSNSEYREECLRRMLSLEAQEPGSCKILFERFGIRNFARYPEDMLLRQYRNTYKEPKEYKERIYFIEATGDNNGSATNNSVPKIAKAARELEEQGVSAVLVEANTGEELKKFARMARRAGWGPARYIISDSHGDFFSIDLGKESLENGDIEQWLGALVAEMTTEDGVIIVNACRSGAASNGFAATLQKHSGREVRGSRAGTWLQGIRVSVGSDGKPQIDTNLAYSNKWRNTQGTPLVTYERRSLDTYRIEQAPAGGSASVEQLCSAIATVGAELPLGLLTAARNGMEDAMLRILEIAGVSMNDVLIDATLCADEAVSRITMAIDSLVTARQHMAQYTREVSP